MSKPQETRPEWLVENSFTVLALLATALTLVITAVHFQNIPAEVWARPNVAALEYFQLGDQLLSVLVLGTLLAFGIRGHFGVGLRFFCAALSGASAYAEMFVMSAEAVPYGPQEFWTPFGIVMSIGSAAMLETMAALMDGLEISEEV